MIVLCLSIIKKLVYVSKLKSVWRVNNVGKQMGDLGCVNCDELVDINHSGHEDDIQFDKLASLKPLCITSLSLSEGPIDLINYGGDCVNNPSSCNDTLDFVPGVLGFVTPLKISPVKKGYFLRSCSKGIKDFSVKHELGLDPGGIYPSTLAIGSSSVLSENVAVNEVLRAKYDSSGFPS